VQYLQWGSLHNCISGIIWRAFFSISCLCACSIAYNSSTLAKLNKLIERQLRSHRSSILPTLADCASFALACGFDIVFAFILVHEYKGIMVRLAGSKPTPPWAYQGLMRTILKIARQKISNHPKIVKQQTTTAYRNNFYSQVK
jgi:hypothetical protein